MVLAKRYDVIPVRSSKELAALRDDLPVDLVVLCHSLSADECDLSSSIVRNRWPHAKILALSVERSSCWKFADRTVRGLDGPTILLQSIDNLLQSSPRVPDRI